MIVVRVFEHVTDMLYLVLVLEAWHAGALLAHPPNILVQSYPPRSKTLNSIDLHLQAAVLQ